MLNITPTPLPEERIAQVLRVTGLPIRVRILLAVGLREVCVCHIEATLGERQALISQHLMQLREDGILLARRSGRFMYYRLADPALLDLVRAAALVTGQEEWVRRAARLSPTSGCPCPQCSDGPLFCEG